MFLFQQVITNEGVGHDDFGKNGKEISSISSETPIHNMQEIITFKVSN